MALVIADLFDNLYARFVGLVLLLAALAALWLWGHQVGAAGVQTRWDADHQRQAAALAAAQAQGSAITTRVVTQYVDRVRIVHEQAAAIIQRVPVYVTAKADAACTVPTGFVRVHDASVQGAELPAAASSTADAPSGVALSAVAATVADNYGTCRETAARLSALQDWTRQQAAVH